MIFRVTTWMQKKVVVIIIKLSLYINLNKVNLFIVVFHRQKVLLTARQKLPQHYSSISISETHQNLFMNAFDDDFDSVLL